MLKNMREDEDDEKENREPSNEKSLEDLRKEALREMEEER